MKEVREPEITLFGRKIMLPESGGRESEAPDGWSGENGSCDSYGGEGEVDKADEDQKLCSTKSLETELNPGAGEDVKNSDEGLESSENAKTPSRDEDGMSEENPKSENEASNAPNGQQKPLKKPDKILPCPRCNSMDTKFCYYNNYNVNQPRHFCKSCQRYWTAGGTMRNVPVGAGRRKNKNSTSHCRHITITEALQAARIDAPNGFHHPGFKPNGTVLSFGPDSALCESMASALNLQDKRASSGVRNGYDKIDPESLRSCKNGEIGDELSAGSSVNDIDLLPSGGKDGSQPSVMQNTYGFPSPVPCIPGVSWPFPWNSAVALPAIYPPGYPIPFYPAPYWNCGVPNGWNVPWLSVPSPTANQPSTGSSHNSPLGKHTRNGELLKPSTSESKKHMKPTNSESSILVPKTLRIDDPEEAAKSSIWETLGIKYDSIQREGLFKALQPKDGEKKLRVTTSPALQANPAALSRSITFQEGA